MGLFDKISGRVTDIIDEVMIPDDVHRAHDTAMRHLQGERYSEALAALKATASAKPNIARTHHLLGRAYAGAGETQSAIDAYEVALSIRPQALTHVQLASVFEDQSRFREAEHHYQAALDTDEKGDWRATAHYGLGRTFLAMGRAGKAAKELRHAAASIESNALQLALAQALHQREHHSEAIETLAGLAELSGEDEIFQKLLSASIHEAMGRAEDARGIYENLATDDVPPTDALMGAARLNLEAGHAAKAEEYARRAAERTKSSDAVLLRAQTLLALGRTEEAQEALQSIAERSCVASLELGRAALMLGKPSVAIPHLEDALQGGLAPADVARAGLALGRARRQDGDLAGARLALLEATRVKGRPEVIAWCRAELAEIALESHDPAEAIVIVQETFDAPVDAAKKLEEVRSRALELLRPRWELPDTLHDPLALSEVLAQVLRHAANDARLTEFVPRIQRVAAQLEAPLSLAIVGEFNAGKSTIVNALIGEDVFPTGVLPTTAHSGILKYGPRKAARVFGMDGSVKELGLNEARELMRTNADAIEHLEFVYPHPALRVVEYWDTPGFNAVDERHEEVAQRALATAEAILWVMDANQVLSQTEFDLIDCVPDAVERLVVVINKIDRLGPVPGRAAAVAKLLAYVEENLAEHMAGVFAMSALNYASGDDEARAQSGFEAFESFLDARILQRAGHIKVVEGRRSLAALLETLSAFQEGLVARTRGHLESVEKLRGWLHGEAVQAAKRASAFVRDLDDQLEFMLDGIELEIAEAMRPSTSVLNSKLVLAHEDREFLLELIEERLASVLAHGFQRQKEELGKLESAIALGLDPVLRGVSLTDSRELRGRMDGFFDESQTLQQMLDARVFRAVRAETRGRVAAAGEEVLGAIVVAQSDRTLWRVSLRTLVPRLVIEAELTAWYIEYFENAYRLLLRAKADLERTQLEAQYRYDFSALLVALA